MQACIVLVLGLTADSGAKVPQSEVRLEVVKSGYMIVERILTMSVVDKESGYMKESRECAHI